MKAIKIGDKEVATRRGKQVTVGGHTVELMTENEAEYLMTGIYVALLEPAKRVAAER